MNINRNTLTQIDWFKKHGVSFVDIGVLDRTTGKMQLKMKQDINELEKLLGFCKYKNMHNSCIYIRPARVCNHSIIFLDDVTEDKMKSMVVKFDCLSIRTSKQGGFQLWIMTDVLLSESDRKAVQTFIQPFFGSDIKSLSGEHFGRLAGFMNNKRKQWVNTYCVEHGRALSTVKAFVTPEPELTTNKSHTIDKKKIIVNDISGKTRTDTNTDLIAALSFIESDEREIWLKVGCALYSIDRKDLWDNWSSSSSKYSEKEQRKAWRSFVPDVVSIKSIFWLANQNGYGRST